MNKLAIYGLCALVVMVKCANGSNNVDNRTLYANSETSDNFIIRWGFQNMCDHIHDPYTDIWETSKNPGGVTLNPKHVKRGDIVFVRQMDTFMREVHPHIENPYLIVTHGDQYETNHDHQRKYLDDEKIIAWFSIHPFKDGHPKFFPIPLGIYQKRSNYEKRKARNILLKQLRENTQKTALVYLNFDPTMHNDREKVIELFADKPYCLKPDDELPFKEYLAEMAHCKFAFSPRGTGPDSYRTWEALLVGTIPIVRKGEYEQYEFGPHCSHSELDTLYEGLPVLVVNDWPEITEEFLHKKYEEIMAKQYDIRPLYLEYWYKKITNVRDTFLQS